MGMNDKAYVITKGTYSDYHICAVTLDKSRAEKLKNCSTKTTRKQPSKNTP